MGKSAQAGRSQVNSVQTGPGPQFRPSGQVNCRLSTSSLLLQTSASAQAGRSQVNSVQTGPGPQFRPSGQENCRLRDWQTGAL